ncbi:TraY domain-containing protein [Sphingopyxis sp. CCNWLW253]|uniref:TraY domain-containing protein n=1 Tax=unclassified Sphingopyxis TaxID=2614943 RepID=UPI003012A65E
MQKPDTSKSRGRPRKPLSDGERPVVTLRFSTEQRRLLEKEADRNGWSLAQEATNRVGMSFLEDTVLGGSKTAELFRLLAGIIQSVEAATGRSWRDDYLTSIAVEEAVIRAFRALSPTQPDDEVTSRVFLDILDHPEKAQMDPELASRVRDYEVALRKARDLGASLLISRLARTTATAPDQS